MVSSVVGYTGGENDSATYKTVCKGDGHTEALKIEYDPSRLSYEDIMKLVIPQACVGKSKPQYKSAVWIETKEEEAIAKKVAKELGKEKLEILPTAPWHDAEDYHQHYHAKSRRR